MIAAQLTETAHPITLHEIPDPIPENNEVVISVKAAGICHSDVHYADGVSYAGPLPITLGHEVAGIVENIGTEVTELKIGDRVCIHYLITCGHCVHCNSGEEQFCASVQMIGKHRDGGWAEKIAMPERNAFRIPDSLPFDEAAVMMCSSSTSLHAIHKANLQEGETVAIFGAGGLGLSAIQLAKELKASIIVAVDRNHENLKLAESFGAHPVNPDVMDPVQEIIRHTKGKGVDVSLELVGNPQTMHWSVSCLGLKGRAAIAGISKSEFSIDSYHQLINKEAQIVGVSDHLGAEIEELINIYDQGDFQISPIVSHRIALDKDAINESLNLLRNNEMKGRTVIVL